MPSDSTRPPDVVLRDDNAARVDSVAPSGMAEARHPPPRPIAHAEEEPSGRGEWWSLLKAVVIGVIAIMLIGWLISLGQ